MDNVCVSVGADGCPLANGVGSNEIIEALLFPNPAEGELVVMGLREDASVTILDATGRQVWSGRIAQSGWRLDVGAWARGCYALNVFWGDEHRSFKFVLVD